jgi:hypothetical protein
VYISPRECPERLLRSGRPVDPDFAPAESLYLRYSVQHFLNGELTTNAIRFRQSVNRGKYSVAEDVLFSETGEYDGLGVLELSVSFIPDRIEPTNGPAYVFFMHHEPIEANYSHSEIWSDNEVRTGTCREPSKTVKIEFRMRLCKLLNSDAVRIEAVR